MYKLGGFQAIHPPREMTFPGASGLRAGPASCQKEMNPGGRNAGSPRTCAGKCIWMAHSSSEWAQEDALATGQPEILQKGGKKTVVAVIWPGNSQESILEGRRKKLRETKISTGG